MHGQKKIQKTLLEVLSVPETSFRGVAKKFEIKASILRFWLKKAKANESLHKSGCK